MKKFLTTATAAMLLVASHAPAGEPAATAELVAAELAGDAAVYRRLLRSDAPTAESFRNAHTDFTAQQRAKYDEMLPETPPTAAEHWKLARWCRSQGLDDRAAGHVRIAATLDPTSDRYQRTLGRRRIDGRWVDPEDHRREQALDEAFADRQAKWNAALAAATRDRSQVETVAARVEDAADPAAIAALAETWATADEALAQRAAELAAVVPHERSLQLLVDLSLRSDWGTVRAVAAEGLKAYDPLVVAGRLVVALAPENRRLVGRAAAVTASDAQERHRRARQALTIAVGQDAGDAPIDWFRTILAAEGTPLVASDLPASSQWNGFTQPVAESTWSSVSIVDERQTSCECFAAGTPVWTDAGQVPVDHLRPGDRVLTMDVDAGTLDYRPVVQGTVRPPRSLLSLTLGGETIRVTPNHRFWVFGQGWRRADGLAEGMTVRGADDLLEVTAVGVAEPEYVYSLVVADNSNYFVGQSAALVHDFRPAGDYSVRAIGQATHAQVAADQPDDTASR